MKNTVFISFLAMLNWSVAAQTSFFVQFGCGVDDLEIGKNHTVFEPSEEAVTIIRLITKATFLEPNFIIKAGDVKNALATVDKGNRYIIYNPLFIDQITSKVGTDWAAYFVFAHEIAHHLNNDKFDLTDSEAMKLQEIKADKFAGAMLYNLGASLDDAQAGVKSIVKAQSSDTHPSRRARLEAIASGWLEAKKQHQYPNTGLKSKPSVFNPEHMQFIEGGTFQMGEMAVGTAQLIHTVTVSGFYLSKYEVTVAEFREFVKDADYITDAESTGWGIDSRAQETSWGINWQMNPNGNPALDSMPVINISWNDAMAYIEWLNDKTGINYRLPTEAEWEYAAGGGQNNRTNWAGSSIDSNLYRYANFSSNKSNLHLTTSPVGKLRPNSLGLFDMSGNVSEWCSDWYGAQYYKNSTDTNPSGPNSGTLRVHRGGGWSSQSYVCQVAFRSVGGPGSSADDCGFRLARSK